MSAVNSDLEPGDTVLQPVSSATIHITGATARSGPATWGQLHLLRHLRKAGDWTNIFNFTVQLPLPEDCDVARLWGVMCEVLRRYESFRTTCVAQGGPMRQVVTGEGELTVNLYETNADQAVILAAELAEQLKERSFDIEVEWPIRCAAVLTGERPAILVLAFNHVALDLSGALMATAEMSRQLAGEEPSPFPLWQPIDQADFEQSTAGAAISRRALDHVRRTLHVGAATTLDVPPGDFDPVRAMVLRMRSTAAIRAAEACARRLRVSSSSVILAAMAVALGICLDRTRVVFELVASNRIAEPQRSLVANIALDAVCLVDFSEASFDQAVRNAYNATIVAYMNGQCDPLAKDALLREQEVLTGRRISLDVKFNDTRTDRSVEPEASAEALSRLVRTTEVVEEAFEFSGGGLYINLSGTGSDSEIMLAGDTADLRRTAQREVLYGVERLLVASAARDIPVHELKQVAGVTPLVRGQGWVRCPGGYVDLNATREIWKRVAGTDVADVYAEPADPEFHRLVGYALAVDGRSVGDIHREFMSLLDRRDKVRAPDWYVRCSAAPRQTKDRTSWEGLQVAQEGSGRDGVLR